MGHESCAHWSLKLFFTGLFSDPQCALVWLLTGLDGGPHYGLTHWASLGTPLVLSGLTMVLCAPLTRCLTGPVWSSLGCDFAPSLILTPSSDSKISSSLGPEAQVY